jgi:hypothetical protein
MRRQISFSIFELRFAIIGVVQRVARISLAIVEIIILSALILAARCANYQDVFVAGNIYFVDADCYARMTRVQICDAQPGLIVRHHIFENFPQGTTPHTTAPFDYLILGLSLLLKPFTAHALDLAGAFVSPLLALLGGWFLWWWSRQMQFRYRWAMLSLYAISPILVQGTELGRPDHQSLSMLLVTIALCAEWSHRQATRPPSARWGIVSGVAWGLAVWNSAYESLILFVLVIVLLLVLGKKSAPHSGAATAKSCRAEWLCFVLIIAIALLIERRMPSLSILHPDPIFKNWAGTIGELVHVSPTNPVWLRWCGYLLLVAPFLIWISVTTKRDGANPFDFAQGRLGRDLPVYVLLVATYFLTIWQARWAYFFVLVFALALPALLAPIKSPAAVWIAFVLSLFPILRDWDQQLWPSETQLAARVERRNESAQLRELALDLRSPEVHPFLAPWWLSPSIAYWSGQAGVAGSSHESLYGIADSARFFLSEDLQKAREILQNHRMTWVFAYDSDRVAQNSAALLSRALPPHPLCRVLDRTPGQAPPFLIFSAQTAAFKLYRVSDER